MDGWKQPIPTNLDQDFGDNKLAKWIYILLLLRARNSDEEKLFSGTLHFLKRGQAVCGRQELAEEFGVGEQSIRTQLKKLEKVYNKITIETTPNGTVVTIKNYDDVVSFNQQSNQRVTNGQPTGNQRVTTNKNDKSVKSDKKYVLGGREVETAKEVASVLLDRYNQLFGKQSRMTDKKYRYVLDRLRVFSPDDLFGAIKKASRSPFHRGENDRGWVADFEYIMRSDENVDKLINL